MAAPLDKDGFVVIPGRVGRVDELARRHDEAVASAAAEDVRRSTAGGDTRVHDLVNRGPGFDHLWLDPLLLELCARLIRRPFKLGSLLSRTVHPGAAAQALHVDRAHDPLGCAMVGFLWMLDPFTEDNGATRFVTASGTKLATGPAGSLVVYDGAVLHGYGANRTEAPRRSLQGAFIARDMPQVPDQKRRITPETLARLTELGRYLLDV